MAPATIRLAASGVKHNFTYSLKSGLAFAESLSASCDGRGRAVGGKRRLKRCAWSRFLKHTGNRRTAVAMVLKCPECGKRLRARAELSGKKVKCPECGRVLLVPAGDASSQPPSDPAPGEAPPQAPGETPDERCPECGAPIRSGAVLCIQCGYDKRTYQKAEVHISTAPQAPGASRTGSAHFAETKKAFRGAGVVVAALVLISLISVADASNDLAIVLCTIVAFCVMTGVWLAVRPSVAIGVLAGLSLITLALADLASLAESTLFAGIVVIIDVVYAVKVFQGARAYAKASSVSEGAAGPRSALAKWSLILGILGFVFGPAGPLMAVPAVVCAHVARRRIKQSGGATAGAGLAEAGLVLGYCSIGLWVCALTILLAFARW